MINDTSGNKNQQLDCDKECKLSEQTLDEDQNSSYQQNKLKPQSNDKTKIYLIITSVIAIISLIFSIMTYSNFKSLESTMNVYQSEIDKSIKGIETKADKNSADTIVNGLQLTNLNLEKWISNGVVTDDFIVERAIFELGYAIIDIYPQPQFQYSYKGNGRYDISDRELKACIQDVIDKIEETYYNNVDTKTTHDFSKLEIVITTKNYSVATYKNGVLKLAGE